MTRKKLTAAIVGSLSLMVSGCDSARLAQFGTFAAAGTAYVTTFHTFTADAGSTFIAADTATLVTARNQISLDQLRQHQAEYRVSAATDDTMSKEYLTNLQKLDAHASLLGAYFAAMTQLTNGKASSSMVTSLDAMADALNTFNPQLENAKFGGKNVKDYMGAMVPVIVAHFEVKFLNDDLKRNAITIDRALSLQEAAVAAISDQMKDSLTASLAVRESTDVLNPYVSSAALPTTWPTSREAFIRSDVTLASADSAKAAISSLHKAFRDLVSNKSAQLDFATLMTDIGKMAGYAAAIKANH